MGPDLSKALFSTDQWLGRYYKENGLDNPASDPTKAAQLLAQISRRARICVPLLVISAVSIAAFMVLAHLKYASLLKWV
ncbi:MAG: hypothetical protein ABWU84_12325 [Pyrobaculum sp.]|uniref:hypothetical protein n=1 Tax=Pyrobaculum sp. TaxID=2004705 RepID=UPI003EEC6F9A